VLELAGAVVGKPRVHAEESGTGSPLEI